MAPWCCALVSTLCNQVNEVSLQNMPNAKAAKEIKVCGRPRDGASTRRLPNWHLICPPFRLNKRLCRFLFFIEGVVSLVASSLTGRPTTLVVRRLQDALRGPTSVNLTILRYGQPSLADGRAESRRTDADGLLMAVPANGPRPPPQYANKVSHA